MKNEKAFWIQHYINLSLKSLGFALILLSLGSPQTQAIWLGQSQINPFLEVQEVYDSNIFRANDDSIVESDFITVISPGIHVELPTARDSKYRFLVDYRSNIKLYGKHGDSDVDPEEELNTMEHRFGAEAMFNLASGFSLNSGYALNLISTAPDFPGDVREDFIDHELNLGIGYSFADRYEVRLEYYGSIVRFDDSNLEIRDFTLHRLEADFFYRLFPSLSVLGGGSYALIARNDPLSDSSEYRGFGGVRFEATSRLTGTVKAGVVSKRFDEGDFEDKTDVYVNGELVAEVSDDTRLFANLYRSLNETSGADASVLSGGYYLVTGGKAGFSHTLGALPNLSFDGSVLVEQTTYPEDDITDRQDDKFEAGIGAEYKFLKYFVIGARYEHHQTDSNLDGNDYSQEIAILLLRGIL